MSTAKVLLLTIVVGGLGCGGSARSDGGDAGPDQTGNGDIAGSDTDRGDAGMDVSVDQIGTDGGSCSSPPAPLPDGGTCPAFPPVAAQAERYRIWIEDQAAPGGGWRLDLPLNQEVTAGGHRYRYSGVGLTGGGPGGSVIGDVGIDVDGQTNQLFFHYEGCAADLGNGQWTYTCALTRTNKSCSGCTPATIGRHYDGTRAGAAGTGTYTFVAGEPPQACGLGIDLLGFVLPGA